MATVTSHQTHECLFADHPVEKRDFKNILDNLRRQDDLLMAGGALVQCCTKHQCCASATTTWVSLQPGFTLLMFKAAKTEHDVTSDLSQGPVPHPHLLLFFSSSSCFSSSSSSSDSRLRHPLNHYHLHHAGH